MKAYNVHLYVLVRVTVREVIAENHQEAIEVGTEAIDLRALFEQLREDDVCYAEDIPSVLIDEIGDTGYAHSMYYDNVDGAWQPGESVIKQEEGES